MEASGHLLNGVADSAGIHNHDARTCCGALTCFGLCYLTDLCCAIPTMRRIEEGIDQYSLPLFPFYECCWPCMRLFSCCYGEEGARQMRENVWPPLERMDPHQYYDIAPKNTQDTETEL